MPTKTTKKVAKKTVRKTAKKVFNHIAFVIDKSGSMSHLTDVVSREFDKMIRDLHRDSESYGQVTEVSVYLFDSDVKTIVRNEDVSRVSSLRGYYMASGYTALAKGACKAIDDLLATSRPIVNRRGEDHAYLVYLLTDGEENSSTPAEKSRLRDFLYNIPGDWTVVAHVPNNTARNYLLDQGFQPGNIAVWETSVRGFETAMGQTASSNTDYIALRSMGIKVSASYFQADASNLTAPKVQHDLSTIPSRKVKFVQNPTEKAMQIRDLIEKSTGLRYELGRAFYSLVKTETVQPQKAILVREKSTGKVYGGQKARDLIGLPAGKSVMVRPTLSPEYDVYVQSTSTNRNVIPKQTVIYLTT